MPTPAPYNPDNITGPAMLKLRKLLGMGQMEFWSALDTTQSGGSRYEREREIPGCIQKLATFVYQDEIAEHGRKIGVSTRARK